MFLLYIMEWMSDKYDVRNEYVAEMGCSQVIVTINLPT